MRKTRKTRGGIWMASVVLGAALVTATAAAVPAPASAAPGRTGAPRVSAVDLGARVPGAPITSTEASGTNDWGVVIGRSYGPSSPARGLVWSGGRVTALPTGSVVTAVNQSGVVVGTLGDQAFRWADGRLTRLGYLRGMAQPGSPSSLYSTAADVNSAGVIVGASGTRAGNPHAFLWFNGRMTDLGTLGGSYSRATAVNDRGQVVGTSLTASGVMHGFIWSYGRMTDLGTLGGATTTPTDVNVFGQVVGTSDSRLGPRAFRWDHGRMTDLGVPPGDVESRAIAINDRGQVIGQGYIAHRGHYGFLWSNGRLTVINPFGGGFNTPTAINNRGQVVGSATFPNGGPSHAFRWTDGTVVDLGVLPGSPAGSSSVATAVNSSGNVVVGSSSTGSPGVGGWRAVQWRIADR